MLPIAYANNSLSYWGYLVVALQCYTYKYNEHGLNVVFDVYWGLNIDLRGVFI